MKPVKEIRFFATNADLANLHVLNRLLPGYRTSDILTEALKALREKLESHPAKEPLDESAEQSIKELFGDLGE